MSKIFVGSFACVRVGLGGCLVVCCGVCGGYYFPGRHSLYSRPPAQSVQYLMGKPSDPKCLINVGFLPIELPLSCSSNSEFCPRPLFNLLYKAFSPHFPDSVLSSRAVNSLLLGQHQHINPCALFQWLRESEWKGSLKYFSLSFSPPLNSVSGALFNISKIKGWSVGFTFNFDLLKI